MRRIASRQNPIVGRFRAAARGDADGVILLDGVHLVDAALGAGISFLEAALAAESVDEPDARRLIDRLRPAGVDPIVVTAPVMAALSPVKSPSPVVALARRPDPRDDEFFDREAPLVIVAVGIQDPGNVGAIVRVAEAAGAAGVVVAGASADPFGWKALRGSMGSALRIPIIVARDLPVRLPQNGRADGSRFRMLATAAGAHRSVFDADLTGPVAIFIGSEGSGLPRAVLDQADEVVSIPMEPSVESLNAATSAAIIAYEARRQRADSVAKVTKRPVGRG